MKRSAMLTPNNVYSPRRSDVHMEPLMLLRELAEEFGISALSLGQLLSRRNGPLPRHGSRTATQKTYYKPSEVRKWWKEVGSL